MSKPIMMIFVNPSAESTKRLDQFLVKYIDQINLHLFIKRIKVTKDNINKIKQMGIEHTPTLVYNKRKWTSLDKIIRILTPPANHKDHYGYGNTSSNELILQYQNNILNLGDETGEDNDMNPDTRESILRNKMTAFQKRRPQMDGVDTN